MKCSRGDVVLVLFPDTNLRTAKRRPAVVVQADGIVTGLPQIVVAMVTSNLSRVVHGNRVLVSIATHEGKKSGLLTDSVIMTDNLATLLEREIDRTIGRLAAMATVDAALGYTLGL